MIRIKLFLLVILSLVLKEISATKNIRPKQHRNSRNVGPASTKADIPTAEQILGKLLGTIKKAPDPTVPAQQFQSVTTAPQSLPVLYPNNPQARSPLKTILGNIPLIPNGAQGATPQTEDGPALPPPPPGYHYGRPRRPQRLEEEYGKSDGAEEDDQDAGQDDDRQRDNENPADEDYHDQRFGIGRGRGLGRQLNRRKDCGHCNCICWKGIKPHVEWVRVPVCYRPCGVCCPKHEEEGACAAICQPCCHQCCHCCHCCCHHPCHCCHCCHCCRRDTIFRPPIAPLKLKRFKNKTPNKKTKIKKKKTTKKAKKRTTKRKQ